MTHVIFLYYIYIYYRHLSLKLWICTLRGLGLDTRLVIALQPIPFKPAALDARARKLENSRSSTPTIDISSQPSTTSSPCTIELNNNYEPSSSSRPRKRKAKANDDETSKRRKSKTTASEGPKVFHAWAEVLLPQERQWISVDVLRKRIGEHRSMVCSDFDMHYVVAFESVSDRMKDVTRRYAHEYATKVIKARCEDWWQMVMRKLAKPLMDEQLDQKENTELYDIAQSEGNSYELFCITERRDKIIR